MSCAHSFGEWCSECIDGMVQQFNDTRRQLAEASQRIEALQAENAQLKESARQVAELNNPTLLAQMAQAVRLAAAEAKVEALTAAQEALIAKWRRIAAEHGEQGSLAAEYSHRCCADELSALLAPPSPPEQPPAPCLLEKEQGDACPTYGRSRREWCQPCRDFIAASHPEQPHLMETLLKSVRENGKP